MATTRRIVILGLSITSSWGNGHATIYRALVRALTRRGHDVLFLEHDKPWYAEHRDLFEPPHGRTALYDSVDQLETEHARALREADLVIVGSYVPEGVRVGRWALDTARCPVAFYDIDTPITLTTLAAGDCDYLDAELVRRYPLYLSFTGGPVLDRLEGEFGSPMARPFYCCVDAEAYRPEACDARWDLGYMGTCSEDRMAKLDRLLIEPARRRPSDRFVVAGPQYPADLAWPGNVQHIDHLPPAEHRRFYNSQRFTLNLTRRDMVEAGYAPSVRLFEAAACGVPIVSDWWPGLDTFFEPTVEILVAESTEQVSRYLRDMSDADRRAVAHRARQRVLAEHAAEHRAQQLERYVDALSGTHVAPPTG